MSLRSQFLIISSLICASACGAGAAPSDATSTRRTDSGATPAGGDAGVTTLASDASVLMLDAGTVATTAPETDSAVLAVDSAIPPQPFDYENQTVELNADLVVPAGATLRVGPGTTFNVRGDYRVDVRGTLHVEGSVESPVAFVGPGGQSSWHGLVLADGAQADLAYVHISGARYGVHALPGSSYRIDRARIDTSFKALVLQSDGTVSNSRFAAVALFPAITEAVAIDDPNGSLTILDASPTVTNCRFDGSGGLNDMIRVGGVSNPWFDHVYVHASHCAFHINGASATARITNSIMEGTSYGIMAFTTHPTVEDSVFVNNSFDIGFCSGATAADAAILRNNFYGGGAIKLDAGCDRIGTADSAPASAANPSAGPSGL